MNEERARPVLTVDLAAVAANTRRLGERTRAELMAVVKADGFGHGAVDVARTALAHGASSLGVATVEEALVLRGAGLTAPVLSWLNSPHADLAPAVRAGIELAVPGPEHLRAAAEAALASGRPARIHLHVDSGMARGGAAPADWAPLCTRAAALERAGRIRVVGVMGHLGCADTPGDPHNAEGRRRFTAAVATAREAGLAPRHRHLAATAALLNDVRTHGDLVRAGAGLYGIDPTGTAGLRWAMTLTAPVLTVRDVPAGTPVGYGHTWTAERPTRLAQVPLGYADGLPRTTSGRAEVLVRGRRRPVVGRISMDQIVVDVGEEPVRSGEVVTLLGPGAGGEPTACDWAGWAGTLPHEILATLGAGSRTVRRVLPAPRTHRPRTHHATDLRPLVQETRA
ncbi:alanine racemase [Streptomyces sp. NPDC054956]